MPERPSAAGTSDAATVPSALARCAARLEASADALAGVSDAWILGTPPAPDVLVAIADDIRTNARALSPPDPRGDGTPRPPHRRGTPSVADASPAVREALLRLADRLERTRRALDDYADQQLIRSDGERHGTCAPEARDR